MSRYLILLILNLPLITLAIVSVITHYKLGHYSRRRMLAQLTVWLLILLGLIMAQPLYNWLFASGYTQTESLSLFDVIQITAVVIVFYIANRLRAKVEHLEQRINSLHQELSIRLSDN